MAEQLDNPAGPESSQALKPPLPPPSNCWRTLNADDRCIVEKLLGEEPDYVNDPRFDKTNIETELFGAPASLVGADGISFQEAVPVVHLPVTGTSRVPSLRTQEEQLLFQRYNYARKRIAALWTEFSGRRLTSQGVRFLVAWGKRAHEIRSLIVSLNVPLVLAMAKRARFNNIDFNEMVSEGNMALLRSVEKFDCGRGFKFSTYSCRAILKSFSRVVMRATRYRGQFPVEFDPAIEQSDYCDRLREDIELDCVEELKGILCKNLAELNDVEQTVIRERFSLAAPAAPPTPPKTLEEVGAIIGVTKERVRQIQNKALRKIRQALEEVYLAA